MFKKNYKNNNSYLGKKGEELASKYLEDLGFKIIAKNYRYKRSEIDIIVQQENLLVFVEVKTRSSFNYGFPEESVDENKIDNILMASESFIEKHDWKHEVRYDIISVYIEQRKPVLEHFEDAF